MALSSAPCRTPGSFNLDGMIAVGLLDPSVVVTVASSLMKLPPAAEEDATRNPSSASLLGIVAIDSSGVAVAIRGSYEIPSYISVNVPVAGWFPFADSPTGGYLRIGSDGFGGRPDDPVTVTVFPGILDFKCWAYPMVEERELRDLGGRGDDFNFTDFSIGFGCGFDFDWGNNTVGLSASATVLVGLGTKPLLLNAGAFVHGHLWLGPAGVSVDGRMVLQLLDANGVQWNISGEFCGSIDLLVDTCAGRASTDLRGHAHRTVVARGG